MNSIANLGASLKVARLVKKMTQKDLAAKVGIAAKRISGIERGIIVPTLAEVILIASALDKSIGLV